MKRHGLLIIAVDNIFTLSLNVFICLNACGLYNICTRWCYSLLLRATKP
jgi:hypothetical protein